MTEPYRPWDQEQKLGPPPWQPDDPKLAAWQQAHGHDVRLKCYPEFGCLVIEEEMQRTVEMMGYRIVVLEQEAADHIATIRRYKQAATVQAATILALERDLGLAEQAIERLQEAARTAPHELTEEAKQ